MGYRVVKKESGKRIVSHCVSFLIDEAKRMGITLLNTEVMNNNPASEKVLIKSGFSPTQCFRRKYQHQGVFHNSIYFELVL
ncbi:GNAT family N-acetyltransferase [Alteromonas marina]